MNNSDMPATPCKVEANEQMKGLGMARDFYARGLTKREAFAMAAMQGLASFDHIEICLIAEQSIMIADALLKELDK